MDSSMKTVLFLMMVRVLLAQPDTDAARFSDLNHRADQYLATYDFNKAEPLLEQALEIATRLPAADQSTAQVRLYDLYIELGKRDRLSWNHIGLPHLLKAIGSAKTASGEAGSQLAVKYALAVLQFTPPEIKPEVSSRFALFLTKWISEREANNGPLHPETAVAYEALAAFPKGSPGQLQALNACELLIQDKSRNVAPQFASLLVTCADSMSQAGSHRDGIRFAEAARQAAASDSRHLAYEIAHSYVVEAEAQASLGDFAKSLSAADSAVDLARKELARRHRLWEEILGSRASALDSLHQDQAASQAKSELKEWLRQHQKSKSEARIQTPVSIKRVDALYTATARLNGFNGGMIETLAMISADGTVKVLATYNELPFGLTAGAIKALEAWRFRPYLLDGTPVAGITTLVIPIRPSN
jgi:hypothetical protein